jgi:hypothetical protein
MALAILELVDFGRAAVNLNIDTGTNRLYVLKVGRSFRNRSGIDWIDDVTYATPPAINENGGNLFRSTKGVSLPAARFSDGARFVQLFTFKSPDHRSPAFSRVVEAPGRNARPEPPPVRSHRAAMSLTATFEPPRRVPSRTAADVVARSASIDEVLASIVKLGAPLVENLLKPGPAEAGRASGGQDAGKDKSASNGDVLANVLAALLRSVFGGGAAGIATGKSMSLAGTAEANRFAKAELSHPFIFGVDDALIGALAGPILQALPQLMNAANQHRLQMKQADNRLISDLLSDVNRRLMLQQLAAAQPPPGSGGAASPELAQLIALLQQAPASVPPADGAPAVSATGLPPTPAAPVLAKSLAMPSPQATLSSRAVLGFVFADPLPWNGRLRPVFAKGGDLHLKVQLNVGNPVPKSPLPKSILKVVFKNAADHTVLLEKTFKEKGIAAGTPLTLDFTAAELAPIPANKPIEAIAEMRWRTASSSEYKALGSSEIVFVGKYLLKGQGSAVASELELTDMKRFRPFWNKVWESPVLDRAGKAANDDGKSLWGLDVNAKYSVVLSPDHDTNGLMETKLLKAADDPDSLTLRTAGRMKAGIELSLSELNKLLPLWKDQAALEPAKLEALATAAFAEANAAELITGLKLSGRTGERGMVWAVPVFKLIECTLASIAKTDDTGQVTALADETVRFPLPVSVRLIGLKSHA